MAMAGDHQRFQWKEQTPAERFCASAKSDWVDFGHPAKIEDGHVTYAHEQCNPASANYMQASPPIFGTCRGVEAAAGEARGLFFGGSAT